MRVLLLRALILHLLAICFPTNASAQCAEHWIAGPECGKAAVGGQPQAVTAWDPDGEGPLSPLLVIAGGIADIGNFADVENICTWDGTNWRMLGAGLNASVRAVISFEGTLIAGGFFTQSGTAPMRAVARWNGTQWNAMDSGLNASSSVEAFCIHNGELYAAGSMSVVDLPTIQSVARWNGSRWVGIANVSGSGGISAMTSHGGKLFVGGGFRNIHGIPAERIACWDGTSWSPLGTGVSFWLGASVGALCSFNGNLYVGGGFDTAGGVSVVNIAYWDGALWHGVGSGFPVAGRNFVSALTVHDGRLHAAVDINEGNTPSAIMALDGSNWVVAGNPLLPGSPIARLISFAGDLYRVGPSVYYQFVALVAGSVSRLEANGIWMTVGQGFASGSAPVITKALEYHNELILTGRFFTVSEVMAPGITSWNGTRFLPLGLGLTGGSGFTINSVNALHVLNDQLYVGGDFDVAGGLPALNVAAWNGESWSTLGAGLNGTVNDLAALGSSLVAVGSFTASGVTTVNRVALWNGTAWVPLGTGLDGIGYAAVVHEGQLYVGGNFRNAGTVAASNIARWNGTNWNRMVAGLGSTSDTIYALEVFQDQLIAAGRFARSGSGGILNSIARWEVGAWLPLGTGIGGDVYDLHRFNGSLFAVGDFDTAGGVAVSDSASWNGLAWSRLAAGSPSGLTRNFLADYNRELIVTGGFTSVRIANVSTEVHGWARWSPGGSIVITQQPADASTCNAGSAAFSLSATVFPDATYQWRRNTIPLSDGRHGLTTISGATTPLLQISNATQSDSGDYDCLVTTDCSSLASSIARFDVCGADFNCDATIDFFDYLDFVQDFSQGSPVSDFNNDEVIDFFDYLDFVQAFSTGC